MIFPEKNKRILIVAEYFPPIVLGGAEVSCQVLVDRLLKEGRSVYVLTPNYGAFTDETVVKKNLTIHRFKSIRYFFFKKRAASQELYIQNRGLFYLMLAAYQRFSAWELARQIEKVCEQRQFDQAHGNNLESDLAVLRAKVKCFKSVHIREFAFYCPNRSLLYDGAVCEGSCTAQKLKTCLKTNYFLAKILRKLFLSYQKELPKADLIIAISNFVKKVLEQKGISPTKIKVVYNEVPEEMISSLSKSRARKMLGIKANAHVVLYAGALTELKGANLLPALAKAVPKAQFIVVGMGPLFTRFKSLNLANLKVVEFVPSDVIRHYYRATDVLLVPSQGHEPFGRAVLEGALNGCQVIASEVGGIPEVQKMRKKSIHLVKDYANYAAFAKKIKSILNI